MFEGIADQIGDDLPQFIAVSLQHHRRQIPTQGDEWPLTGWQTIQLKVDFVFDQLVEQGQVKRMAFEGKTRIRGEVRDQQSDEAKALNLTGGKFAVNLPPLNDITAIKKKVEDDDKAARAGLSHRPRSRRPARLQT